MFNHRSNVDINNRIVCYDIKELGKQLKKIGMLVVQDQVWNRVTINRAARKSTRYYIDEMHLLLKEEQTAAIRWRFGSGSESGAASRPGSPEREGPAFSREVENIFENCDFVYMLNQAAATGRFWPGSWHFPAPAVLCDPLRRGRGAAVLRLHDSALCDHFPKDTELYRVMTTKPQEVASA